MSERDFGSLQRSGSQMIGNGIFEKQLSLLTHMTSAIGVKL